MKKAVQILLVLIGCAPAAVGLAMDRYIMEHLIDLPPFKLIGVVFLLVTALIAFLAEWYLKSTKQVVLLLDLPAFADLILVFVQMLTLHEYWANLSGTVSQLFYLPLLNLGWYITSGLPSVTVLYTVCFLMIVLATLGGCKLSRKRRSA